MSDLNASEMTKRMTRGKGYTTTELGKLFKTQAKAITPTLTAAMRANLIIGMKVGADCQQRTLYYVAGSEPQKTLVKAPEPHRWQVGVLTGYQAGIQRDVELRLIGRGR
jgi:hypothetical protein